MPRRCEEQEQRLEFLRWSAEPAAGSGGVGGQCLVLAPTHRGGLLAGGATGGSAKVRTLRRGYRLQCQGTHSQAGLQAAVPRYALPDWATDGSAKECTLRRRYRRQCQGMHSQVGLQAAVPRYALSGGATGGSAKECTHWR